MKGWRMPSKFLWTVKGGVWPRTDGEVEVIEDHLAEDFARRGLGRILEVKPKRASKSLRSRTRAIKPSVKKG